MPAIRGVAKSWAAGAVLVCTAACATGTSQQKPDIGRVTVGVTTTGTTASTLTFRVTIEPAGIAGSVKAAVGVFTKDDVPLGEHVVRLVDVPADCQVDGGAERKIMLSEQRRNAVLRFEVRCR